MTPHEERLVLELHSKWGNRWSRIARKLPGRTDNEIKNYWRTHMRKKAQERKKVISPSSSSSSFSSNSSSSTSIIHTAELAPVTDTTTKRSFYDTRGLELLATPGAKKTGLELEETSQVYSMDEIWKDVELSEESCNFTPQAMTSPIWDIFGPTDSLWSMDDEEQSKMMMMQQTGMGGDHFNYYPFYNHTAG